MVGGMGECGGGVEWVNGMNGLVNGVCRVGKWFEFEFGEGVPMEWSG